MNAEASKGAGVNRRELLRDVRRVVLKLGTRVVTVHDNELNSDVIARVAADVSALRDRGIQVAVVSSGAVGAGMGCLGLRSRPGRIPELQATAAVGQGLLMNAYQVAFEKHGVQIGQVLLTDDDLEDRFRYVNARNTLEALFRYRAVPIVNENDSVAVQENKVGDNDRLSALVTHLAAADLLVTFTTVDGLYTADPSQDPAAEHVRVVNDITPELMSAAGTTGSPVSLGGMRTKLQAAESVTTAGVPMVIASGLTTSLLDVVEGEGCGTLFLPHRGALHGRKLWLANTRKKGAVIVDEGAAQAVAERGKSLLPSGVLRVTGVFGAGEMIGVELDDGREIARGLVRYSADDLEKIKGMRTSDIENVLGQAGDAVIHRDDLVLLPNGL